MSKKVAMVSAGFYPYLVGGAERQALELSAALVRRGWQVTVLTRRLPGLAAEETVRGVAVVRLWRCGSGAVDSLSFMASVFAWLILHPASYSAVHAHLAGSPALAAALAGRLLFKRVVVKLGGGKGIGELAVSSRSLVGRAKLFMLGCLKPQFVAVARELAEEAGRYLGNVPLQAVPNGVDAERFRPDPARKTELRRRLGVDGVVFLYAGRLSEEKRLPAFVESWAHGVRDARQPATLLLVGEGSEEGAIRAAMRRVEGGERARILPPTEDILSYYQACDVFVLPSISEGLSNALLEAMACGLGVLATSVGGTAEAVVEGQSGLLFKPGEDDRARALVRRLVERPTLAGSLGEAARRRVVELYSLDRVATLYEALYGAL